MDGFIGLSSRRLNLYTKNLGIQKIGLKPYNSGDTIEVVGYYECSVSVSAVLSSPGITSPPMYLKAGDVVYIMGCEGYIGSTTVATAATTFTNQGRANVWNPYITNVRTGAQTFSSWQEAAMLNARQNEWSPGNFLSTDWASVGPGATATLGTYRSFLALKIIRVTETGMYRINTAYGPRGTGTQARHVYCTAFRGVDISRLSTLYFQPVAGDTQFVKSPRSRISTGQYLVGVTTPPYQIDAFLDYNIFNIGLANRIATRGDRYIHIGMIPELDLIADITNRVKDNSQYTGWVGSLWTDQYDGLGGLSSLCGLDYPTYPTYSQTYNHSGVLALTPSLVVSTCYQIIVPSL